MNANLSKAIEIARKAARTSVREYFRPLTLVFRVVASLLTRKASSAISLPVDNSKPKEEHSKTLGGS